MPEDYESGNFHEVNVLECLPTYPMDEQGDPDHVVYKLLCRVKRTSYLATKPPLDSPMTPGSSGITAANLPVSDASALFVGDTGHRHLPHDRIEFTRTFATIPRNQTGRLVGSRTFPFPAYQSAVQKTPESENDDLYRISALRTSNSNPAPVYKDIQYFLLSGVVPTIPDVFRATLDGNAIDYVSDGNSGTFNGTALNGDSVNQAWSVAATSPTLTEYKAKIAAGEELIVDVAMEQYLGNIHRLVTWKMKAQ